MRSNPAAWVPPPSPRTTAVARLLLSKADAADAMGLSIRTVGSLIREGQLRSVQIGRRRLIPAAAITEFIAARETGGERDT